MSLSDRGICFLAAIFLAASPVSAQELSLQEPNLYAIAERDGSVVLCLSKAQILFADRCAGTGRLMIVQPVQEGEIVWRTAVGTIAIESEPNQNPDCGVSRAKWSPRDERAVPSGKRIRKVDPSSLLTPLNKQRVIKAPLLADDISAYSLDLDNDGKDEIIFTASNLDRVSRLNEKTGEESPYVVMGGITKAAFLAFGGFPSTFYFEQGEYTGGTDAIGQVMLKGVVPIAPETGEIALLVLNGNGSDGMQDLIRFRGGLVQRIQTIQRRCD
jgi:hypothetical protein